MIWEWEYIVSVKIVGVEVYTSEWLINLWNLEKFWNLVGLNWINTCYIIWMFYKFDYIMIIESDVEYIII